VCGGVGSSAGRGHRENVVDGPRRKNKTKLHWRRRGGISSVGIARGVIDNLRIDLAICNDGLTELVVIPTPIPGMRSSLGILLTVDRLGGRCRGRGRHKHSSGMFVGTSGVVTIASTGEGRFE